MASFSFSSSSPLGGFLCGVIIPLPTYPLSPIHPEGSIPSSNPEGARGGHVVHGPRIVARGPHESAAGQDPGSGSFIPARPCLTDLWRMYIKVALGDSDRPRLDGYPSTPLLAQLGEQIRELIVNGPWCTPWRRPTPYGVMERFLLHP